MSEYDVVIVGSGVAGAICADRLAAAGKKVLILEAGSNGIGSAQREQYRRVWDPKIPKSWNTPYLDDVGRKFYPSPSTNDTKYFDQPAVDPANPNDDATSLRTFKAYYQRLLGGSTWAWRGNTPRMMPNDLRLASIYFPDGSYPDGANVADWPVSYEELMPWYLRAEEELGVAGNAEEWEQLTPRDGVPYPMPGQPKSYSDKILVSRMGELSVDLDGESLPVRVFTMAQARNTRPYQGRPACEGNHNCIPLCPTHAKYDATIHLRQAVLKGAEIRTAAVVVGVAQRGDDGRWEVTYKNWRSERPKESSETVSGDRVILAANPIETPKILLMSRLGGPQVGKYLMDHVQGEALALAPEPIFPFRGPQTLCGIDSLRDGRYRSKFASFRLTLGNDGWGREGNPTSILEGMLNPTKPNEFKIGADLRKAAVERLIRLVRIGFSTEQLPHASNCVTLSEQEDDLGIPRPLIRFEVHKYTQDALQHGHRVALEIFHAMGAEPHAERPEEGPKPFNPAKWNTAGHPMGTCRMGPDAATSVVNKFGECHAHPGMYVVGASTFPTGSATNPVLTLSALALMTVDNILASGKCPAPGKPATAKEGIRATVGSA
ncbi:GMC family oxidoreductase [Nitrobacter sp. TKz-YC02]|uniref:GMC family oxidoreductase n=1 Tax=Nitrobacter sp. TKz-YC02 TaxID=3398704 RepID=UPI003CF6ADDF